MEGVIDIHCHLIPSIDDGAVDEDECISMLNVAKNEGISVIFATPHYRIGRWENSPSIIKDEVNKICDLGLNMGVTIYPGTEIYYVSEVP
jgi:protein-tyrosine phosphatase